MHETLPGCVGKRRAGVLVKRKQTLQAGVLRQPLGSWGETRLPAGGATAMKTSSRRPVNNNGGDGSLQAGGRLLVRAREALKALYYTAHQRLRGRLKHRHAE